MTFSAGKCQGSGDARRCGPKAVESRVRSDEARRRGHGRAVPENFRSGAEVICSLQGGRIIPDRAGDFKICPPRLWIGFSAIDSYGKSACLVS